jgi:hypothetical protein
MAVGAVAAASAATAAIRKILELDTSSNPEVVSGGIE